MVDTVNEETDGTSFTYESVLFTAIRKFPDEEFSTELDLRNVVAELNIFEDLNKSYLSAQIVVADDSGILDTAKIKGTETISIVLGRKPESGDTSPYFRLDFKVVSILKQSKSGDRAEVYVLNCISKHGYDDAVVKLSKSFTGKLEDISESILTNYLDVDILRSDKYYNSDQGSVQDPIKVVLPYLSPLESVEWLINRATDRWGTPFFIWASIWGQQSEDGSTTDRTALRIGNFMTMVSNARSEASENEDESKDFIYSQVATNASASEGYQGQGRIIKNIDFDHIENTLKMIQEGAVGSTISNFDTGTSQNISKVFSANKLLDTLNNNGEDAEGTILQTVYDQEDAITFGEEQRFTSYWSARERSMVSSYGTYGSVNSIHDAIDESSLLNKVRPLSIRSMLDRNKLSVTVDGVGILEDQLSVGDIIKVNFLTADTENYTTSASSIERSGFYLIQKTRHIFGSRHNVVLSICKVAQTETVNDNSLWDDFSDWWNDDDEADF